MAKQQPIHWHHRLSVRMALRALVVALVLGMLLALLQVILDFHQERQRIVDGTRAALTAQSHVAYRTVYTLDPKLAEEVVAGIDEYRHVTAARVVDETGRVLAERSTPPSDRPTRWLTDWLLNGHAQEKFSVLLEGQGSNDRPLGNLEATIDWDLAYMAFYERALMIFAAAFAFSTVLAFILVAVFHLALTRPLTRLARILSEFGLEPAGQTFVPDIHGHDRDELGRIVRVVNNFIDATARHAAEREANRQAVENSERRFRGIVEQMPVAILLTDAQGAVIRHVNRMAGDILGVDPSQLVGQFIDRFGLIVPPRLSERGPANSIMPRGKECRLTRSDGTVAWCLVTVLPVFLSGEHLRLFALTDLTREKESSEMVIQMSKLASLGEAAAAIAHELQQPLGIISLSSELAMNSVAACPIDRQRVDVHLKRILDQAHRSANIVRRMLHFGRRSTGSQGRVSIRESVETVALLASIRLMPRNIELVTDIATTCPPVSGDSVRIEQVLLNLINNAHDAIVQQGVKAYATAGAEEGGPQFDRRVTLRARPADDGAHVLLSVEDTGGGIPPTTLPYLFTPFFTTKAPGEGTGLGLSISKGLVEEMGGRIQAENTAYGARFTITLPSAS